MERSARGAAGSGCGARSLNEAAFPSLIGSPAPARRHANAAHAPPGEALRRFDAEALRHAADSRATLRQTDR